MFVVVKCKYVILRIIKKQGSVKFRDDFKQLHARWLDLMAPRLREKRLDLERSQRCANLVKSGNGIAVTELPQILQYNRQVDGGFFCSGYYRHGWGQRYIERAPRVRGIYLLLKSEVY